MNKAIFLDRDGVIIYDWGYIHRMEHFKLLPNAVEGLKLLRNHKLFIVTNQSGIGRGLYNIKDFLCYNDMLIKELRKNNITVQKTYFCPHKPEDNCECRKPKTKFLEEAKKEFSIALKKSFVVGDKTSDIEMGNNAGCGTILVSTGYGKKSIKYSKPDYVAKDLADAAKWIIKNDKQ